MIVYFSSEFTVKANAYCLIYNIVNGYGNQ